MVDFVSSSTGFACRDNHGIYRTMDGGRTWTLVQPVNAGQINDLCAFDATHAWVQVCLGTDEGQYRTVNGTTWTKSTPPGELADVAFTDVNNGWAVANIYPVDEGIHKRVATSTIYKTTDGGASWNTWRTTTNQELLCVAVPSTSRVLFGGASVPPFFDGEDPSNQAPRVVVMTDSGTTFTNVTLPGADSDVVDLVFSGASRGWAALSDQVSDFYDPTDASGIATTANGGDGWTILEQPGRGALDCNSSGTALAVAGAAWVYNGLTRVGYSWDVLRASAGGDFQRTDCGSIDRSLPIGDLSFADADHGWALHPWSVSRTVNGGASWQTQAVMTESPTRGLNAIAASSSSTVWVVGSNGIMYKSADGGASWTAVDPATSLTLVDVAFGSASVGWAVGGASLQRTTNGGQTWLPVTPDVKYAWDGVAAPSASLACFTGRDSSASRDCIVRTVNGGAAWEPVLIAGAGIDLKGVWFRTATDGWAYGSKGTLYHTTDGGATWPAAGFGSVLTAEELAACTATDVVFETATKGWAICELGLGGPTPDWMLLGTTDGGVTWTDARASTGLLYSDELRAAASVGGRTWLGGFDATLIADFNADPAPPVTTSSYNGKWTSQPVALTLGAVDAGAGVAYSRYRYKTTPWAYGTAFEIPAPSDHSNDGAWQFQYHSVDVLGQAETAKTQLIKIDTKGAQGAVVEAIPGLVGGTYAGPNPSFRWSGLDWATPVAVDALDSVSGVDVAGDRAYVLDGRLLRIIDLARPMAPHELGAVDLEVGPAGIEVVGEFAYVAAGADGLLVVDVANAGSPRVIGATRVDGVASQVAVGDGAAYVAAGEGGVAIVDVRDPEGPRQIDAIPRRPAVDVAVEREILCVAADRLALTYDVSRPDRPSELGGVELGATPQAIALSGEIVGVAAGTTQYVLGLGGGGRPELLDSYASGYDCRDVAVNGVLLDFVFQSGILVLDATAPDTTVFAGAIRMPVEPPIGVAATGEYAYIADGTGGLQIMRAMPIEAASYVLDADGQFTGPDETPEPDARSASFAGVSEGVKYFRVKTRDQAGNWNAHVDFQLTVDATGPVPLGNADFEWHRTKDFVISPYDLLSGVASTQYRVNGGPWKAGTSVVLDDRQARQHQRGQQGRRPGDRQGRQRHRGRLERLARRAGAHHDRRRAEEPTGPVEPAAQRRPGHRPLPGHRRPQRRRVDLVLPG